MKVVSFLVLCCTLVGYSSSHKAGTFQPVAVVELFTSEGCSSCPAAEQLLSTISAENDKKDLPLFTLAYHVDYWDRLGWRDSFSSKQFTARQYQYAEAIGSQRVYTPQAIVNGISEMVGSDADKLRPAITTALQTPTATAVAHLSAIRTGAHTISLDYSLTGDYAHCEVHAAVVALLETTAVRKGENSGRTLRHSHVVRQLLSQPATATGQLQFTNGPIPAVGNTAIMVFVQQLNDSKIVAAAMTQL